MRHYLGMLALLIGFSQASAQQIRVSADQMRKKKGEKTVRLTNNVEFHQGDMHVYSNVADHDQANNSFVAWGDVRVDKGPAMTIYSDRLAYDGNTKQGEFRNNIRLVQEEDTLFTDYLDFNSGNNTGYFYNGGLITDSAATLECESGYFYSDKDLYVFNDSVRVYNEDYTLYSDTLHYYLNTETAQVFGPSEIVGDSSYVYCEAGEYNMANNKAWITDNALVMYKSQIIIGDSLFFDQEAKMGEAFGHVWMRDTAEAYILEGHYAEYFHEPQRAFITDSALMMDASNPEDTLYLHADTLRLRSDSANNRYFFAYPKAQIYKADFQARTDSIYYSMSDSVISMFERPLMWNGYNQITADSVYLFLRENAIHQAKLYSKPLIISWEGEQRFNQIGGSQMTAFFRDNTVYRLDVESQAQTIYYVYNDQQVLMGINVAICEQMRVLLADNLVKRVIFYAKPEGTMYPVNQMPSEKKYLDGFDWLLRLRPRNPQEIFHWKQ